MNIIYLGSFRLPNYDAASTRVRNIGYALKASGHTISYISWGGKYDNKHKSISSNKYLLDEMEYIITNELDAKSFFQRFFNKIFRGNKTFKIIKNINILPDIIITYNTPYLFNKKLRNFCNKKNIKLIADITEWYNNQELKFIDIFFNKLNMEYEYKKFKNKICISSYLANYYSKSNNIIIPPLTNHDDYKWKYKNIIESNDYNGLTFIYAGSPAKKDKISTIIEVLNDLIVEGMELRIFIIGISKEEFYKKYINQYNYKEYSDKIIFLGRIKHDLIPSYYYISDFMILLREKNRKSEAGFPTKFTESLTSGTPVIANITSDLSNYLIDGETGFIVPSDSYEDLKYIIKTKLSHLDKNELNKLREKTKEKGMNLDYEKYVENLNNFINNLI